MGGGGGKSGAKSAKAPDYSALAAQQGQINKDAAADLTAANRPNQVDAFGNSINWSQPRDAASQTRYDAAKSNMDYYNTVAAAHPGWETSAEGAGEKARIQKLMDAEQGTWTQTQTLNPQDKATWDKYKSDASQAGSSFGNILNQYLSSYKNPDLAQYDPNSSDKSVSDALYGSVMDRGRVEQQRESDALTSQLRNSGLVPGSEAYDRAMKNLMTSQNDSNLLAAQNATLAGGQEARAQYQTQLGGQVAQRNQGLQELSGMAGMAGGTPYSPTYPGFGSATGYNPTDLVGAAQAQQSASQTSANASNSKKGGLLGAGSSLGGSYLGSK